MPPAYRVRIERSAERDLKRLSTEELRRVVSHIRALADSPRPVGCRKLSGSEDDWRLRVGDYRIIYTVDDEAKVVQVMKVRHRREAYR
ncbi:MAG TPA: type II toxin-antitoxin system RelE/ParE family toxin [Dehalococcoidia bacterium]|nr:type II toxin-antitoxin system RelE/ParE family toxin [Dehalococcoidia bacterium]